MELDSDQLDIELDDLPAWEGEKVSGTSTKFSGKAPQRTRAYHEDDEVMFLVIGKVQVPHHERDKRKGLVRAHVISVKEAYPAGSLVSADVVAELRLTHKRALDRLAGTSSTDDLEADLLAEEQRLAAEEALAEAGGRIGPDGTVVTPAEAIMLAQGRTGPSQSSHIAEDGTVVTPAEAAALLDGPSIGDIVRDISAAGDAAVLAEEARQSRDVTDDVAIADAVAHTADDERGMALEMMRVHGSVRDGYYTPAELDEIASNVSVTRLVEMYRAAEGRALAGVPRS